jgi:hypothetical protein
MPHRLSQILFAIEFLIALMASITLWSQAGGQYHLDLMPWYWKLGLPMAAATAFTRLTMCRADASSPKSRAAAWLVALLLVIGCAGTVTYYYHLYEPQDNSEETTDENARWNGSSSPVPARI